jgi:hypothetical protein
VFDLTDTLPYFGWLMALGAAIFVTICDELLKWSIRRKLTVRARWAQMNDKFEVVITEMRAANRKIDTLEQTNQHLEQMIATLVSCCWAERAAMSDHLRAPLLIPSFFLLNLCIFFLRDRSRQAFVRVCIQSLP